MLRYATTGPDSMSILEGTPKTAVSPAPSAATSRGGSLAGGSPPPGLSRPAKSMRVVLLALLIATFLSALDASIVSTAMPTIVGKLGGFSKYTWVTTAYIVTQTISTMLLGKLGDLFGRRGVFLWGIGIFVVGSALCGLAQNMNQLIVFRGIQGIGGGGIFGLSFAIIGDLVPPATRGKYFGFFTSTFALANIAGPLVGGVIVDHTSWRWIFYVNLPLGILALAMAASALHLPPGRRAPIDFAGAGLLIAAITAFMVALEQGDQQGWSSAFTVVMFVVALVATVGFIVREKRAPEPILPMHLFKNDILRTAYLMAFLLGSTVMAVGLFFALFFQDVGFNSPTRAGLMTFPMMFGATIASIIVGRRISSKGRYRIFPIIGASMAMVACILASRITVNSSYPFLALSLALLGLGLGTSMPPLSIAVQNAGDQSDIGVVTASWNFFRTLGSAVGLAVNGAMLTMIIGSQLRHKLGAAGGRLSNVVRDPRSIKAMADSTRRAVQESITTGISRIFLLGAALTLLSVLVSFTMREIPLRQQSGVELRAAME